MTPNILAMVPFEVLALIFELVASEHSKRSPHPPLFLSAVCKQWREVSFLVPALWNRIAPFSVANLSLRLSHPTAEHAAKVVDQALSRLKTYSIYPEVLTIHGACSRQVV